MVDDAWSARFEDPVVLPDGRRLETLREARHHLLTMKPDAAGAEERHIAAGELLKAASHGGLFLFTARIAMGRALQPVDHRIPTRTTGKGSSFRKSRLKRDR